MNKFNKEVLKLIKTCNSATILDVDCEVMISKLFNKQLQQELDKYELIASGGYLGFEDNTEYESRIIFALENSKVFENRINHDKLVGKNIEIYIKETKE